jgi:hypothetical protein
MGTKLPTVRLDLRATLSIKEQATLMLEGMLGRSKYISHYVSHKKFHLS